MLTLVGSIPCNTHRISLDHDNSCKSSGYLGLLLRMIVCRVEKTITPIDRTSYENRLSRTPRLPTHS